MKYDAFISYNHAVDGRLGPAVRDGLHRFARPWYRLRALRVFCDLRSLSATEGLWPTIEAALDGSRCLVLLASPESAESVWVRREIERWQRIEPKRPILIGLTGGEIVWDHEAGDFDWERTTALPTALRGWFADEPLWIDLSKSRQEALSEPEFLDAIATLSAALHGRDKDDLIGEDVRQHRKAKRFRRFSWAGLSVLTVLALVAATVAYFQRSNAIEQRDTALANQLVAEAATIQESQPGLARQLIAAAYRLKRTPQVESAVIGSGVIPQEIHADASALAYTADGSLLAVARSGRAKLPTVPEVISHIWLHDSATLSVVSEWSLDSRSPIYALAFSANAHLLAVAHSDDVVLWDVTNPRAPVKGTTLTGHRDTVKTVSFSPDGRTLATGGRDGALRLWDVATGKPLAEQQIAEKSTLRFAVRFPSSGNLLATMAGGYDAKVRMWDVSDPRAPRPVGEGIDGVQAFDLASDGRRMVTRSEKELRVWDVGPDAIPTALRVLPLPGGPVKLGDVVFGAGGQVAAVSEDGFVRMWDVSGEPALAAELPLPKWDSYNVEAFTLSPNGSKVAIATPGSNSGPSRSTLGGTVRIWNVADGRERRAVGALTGHVGKVSDIAVSPDGRTVASAGGGTVRLWDLVDPANPALLASVPAAGEVALAFSPDGSSLVVAGDKTARLLDISDRKAPRQTGMWAADLTVEVAFSGDGRLLAVASLNAGVDLYDTTHPERREPVGTLPVVAWSLVFQPDRPVIALAVGASKNIELWDVSTPEHGRRLSVGTGHTYQVLEVDSSADGSVLASGARDSSVRTWHLEEGRLVESAVITDTGDVNAIAVSRSGHRLATLGRDETIRVYDLVDGVPTPALVAHVGNGVRQTISFVRDDLLAVATEHGVVDLWNLDASAAVPWLCAGVGDPITEEQWRRNVPDLPYSRPC